MKVTINKPEDSIDLSQVTEDMYFVGTIKGKANCFLTKEAPLNGYKFLFSAISHVTKGNYYDFAPNVSITEAIKAWATASSLREVHAFHTYQEAFKFIAENL